MEFAIPTNDLTIAPDRGKILMSDALKGRVPVLEDTFDPRVDGEHADPGIDAAVREVVTLVVERHCRDDDTPEHLIGPLVAIECDPTGCVRLSLRVSLEEALTAVHDASNAYGHLYAGAQVHRDEEDEVIRVGPPAEVRKRPGTVGITDITLAGTCTLTVTLS